MHKDQHHYHHQSSYLLPTPIDFSQQPALLPSPALTPIYHDHYEDHHRSHYHHREHKNDSSRLAKYEISV